MNGVTTSQLSLKPNLWNWTNRADAITNKLVIQ